MLCPMCGKQGSRFEVIDFIGDTATYLCCGVPAEIVENWEVYEGLPDPLKQVAVDKILAEYAAIEKRRHEYAERFAASRKRWLETHGQQYQEGRL